MFTQSQIEKYLEGVEFFTNEGEEVVPPRTFNVDDYPNFPGERHEFGEGTILVLGLVAQDLGECECGHSHISYAPVREDGMIGGMVTSGTIGEAMALHPELDPLALFLGAVDPDSMDEGIAPTWDEMREVTPDEWPVVELKTDMTEFEF